MVIIEIVSALLSPQGKPMEIGQVCNDYLNSLFLIFDPS